MMLLFLNNYQSLTKRIVWTLDRVRAAKHAVRILDAVGAERAAVSAVRVVDAVGVIRVWVQVAVVLAVSVVKVQIAAAIVQQSPALRLKLANSAGGKVAVGWIAGQWIGRVLAVILSGSGRRHEQEQKDDGKA